METTQRRIIDDQRVGANLVFAALESMAAMRSIAGDHQDRPYDCDAAIDYIGTIDLLPTDFVQILILNTRSHDESAD